MDLNGQAASGLYCEGASVVGAGTSSADEMHFTRCDFGAASVQRGHFDKCGFAGTLTMTLAADYDFHDCYSKGDTAPIFTKTGGQVIVVEFQNYAGDITISGLEASDTIELGGFFRTITLSGSGGTVHVHGHYETISSGGFSGTLTITGAIQTQDVADILEDTSTTIPASLPAALTKSTADSGSATTVVDALRTEGDTDYWKYSWIRFTSGTISGQTRLITGFTPASDTITFAPATTQNVGTNTYEILPAGSVDIQTWIGTLQTLSATTNKPEVDVLSIDDNSVGATRLAITASRMVPGVVDDTVSPTTTVFESDITQATADHFNGRIIIWTSGQLEFQATDITDYELNGGRGKFTVTAMTEAPVNNDTFIIV